jgi:hypothetical protein
MDEEYQGLGNYETWEMYNQMTSNYELYKDIEHIRQITEDDEEFIVALKGYIEDLEDFKVKNIRKRRLICDIGDIRKVQWDRLTEALKDFSEPC